MTVHSSLFHSGTRTPSLPDPAPPPIPPPAPLPQAPVPPLHNSPTKKSFPSLEEHSPSPLPSAPSSCKRPPPTPWAPWRRSPQRSTVAPSMVSPPGEVTSEKLITDVLARAEAGLKAGGVGDWSSKASGTGKGVGARELGIGIGIGFARSRLAGIEEKVSVASDDSSVGSVGGPVLPSPVSPLAVSTLPSESRSPHRPPNGEEEFAGGSTTAADTGRGERKGSEVIVDDEGSYRSRSAAPLSVSASASARGMDCGGKDDDDAFSASIANASLGAQGVWVTAPTRAPSTARRQRSAQPQPAPSTPHSASDCSDPRDSGTTCWSSGVGGEAGLAAHGFWVAVDSLMMSPPGDHGVAENSSEVLMQAEAPLPLSVSPPHPRRAAVDTIATEDRHNFGEDLQSPPAPASSASSPSLGYSPPYQFAPAPVRSPSRCLMLDDGSDASRPSTPLSVPPAVEVGSQQRPPAAAGGDDVKDDVGCGGGGAGQRASAEDPHAQPGRTLPSSSASSPTSPLTTRTLKPQPRTPPERITTPDRQVPLGRTAETHSRQDTANPTRRRPRSRTAPTPAPAYPKRKVTHAAPAQSAPQPPHTMQPTPKRGLPAHALPARAPAWGTEMPVLSPKLSSQRGLKRGLSLTPNAVPSATLSPPSLTVTSSSSRRGPATSGSQHTEHVLSPTSYYSSDSTSPLSSAVRPPLLHLVLELLPPPMRPYAPPPQPYTPPSPAGRSSSISPSSVLSSSPFSLRSQLMHATGGGSGSGTLPLSSGSGTLPSLPPRDPGASAAGVPLAWSWSDSTMSACSRTGGGCGGAGSACMSASPDPNSPLVGIRFIPAGGATSASSAGAVSCGTAASWGAISSAGGGGGSSGLSGDLGAARCGAEIGRSRSRSASPARVQAAPAADGGGGGDTVAVVGENEVVPRTDLRRHRGVGGREGKRPRRFFFP